MPGGAGSVTAGGGVAAVTLGEGGAEFARLSFFGAGLPDVALICEPHPAAPRPRRAAAAAMRANRGRVIFFGRGWGPARFRRASGVRASAGADPITVAGHAP
jgi:hypothetical protein